MTRLVEADIRPILVNLKKYDGTVKQQTGMALMDIAMQAAGLKKPFPHMKTAVVPVTSGLGIIDGFSAAVCGILSCFGIDAFVTEKTDVGGIQEAYKNGAELIFMADDDVCSAFSLREGVYSDNGYATGIGFAAALKAAMDRRKGTERKVLVLGLGPVGCAAAEYLQESGCEVWVYDSQEGVLNSFIPKHPGIRAFNGRQPKKAFPYIYDATPVANVILREDVTKQTVIAAPGIPLGVETEAKQVAEVIHNPLELGILTMYCECVKNVTIQNLKEESR